MRRERSDAHRDDRSFGAGQGPDRDQELVGARSIDDAQDRLAALRESDRPLAAILRLGLALDEAPAHQAVDQPARGRRRPADCFRDVTDRHRAGIGQHVQRRELGEAEAQLAELAGEADHQLTPQRTAHRHALADLAHVGQAVTGGNDRRREVLLEATGDRTGRCRSAPECGICHPAERRPSGISVQACMGIAS